MAAATQAASSLDSRSRWFLNLLYQELAPYPGRLTTVVRMVISSSIIALLIMTFQLPGAALGGFYTLIISRENPRSTLESGMKILVAFSLGAVYAVIGVMVAVDYPLTHFLWVLGTIFLIFFVIRVVPNYPAAAAFSFVIATAIPIWDVTGPIEAHLYATLWTTWSVGISVLVTVAVEFVAQGFSQDNNLVSGILERLSAIEGATRAHAEARPIPESCTGKLVQFATVGSSRLRLLLSRARFNARYTGQMNATVSLVDRLVDMSTSLLNLHGTPTEEDRNRLTAVANTAAELHQEIGAGHAPPRGDFAAERKPSAAVPVLPELERILSLLPYAFSGEQSISDALPPTVEEKRVNALPWVEDAFTNSEHLRFALRGTLAATASYVIYNALDWPGISTALATCIITALSNIGSSRQKQLLRLTGAVIGGFGFGIGAQMFLFPNIDSITGFLLVFSIVTAIAAWVTTASPRISYVGLQIALAWDLINLSEPRFQLSMVVARDRVVGIAVGLICMWVFFENLWPVDAAEQMLEIFTTNLRLLARVAVANRPGLTSEAMITGVRHLRNQLNTNFAQVNAQADAVHFERGGPQERRRLVRQKVLHWQPSLRTMLLTLLAIFRYRIEVKPDQIDPAIMTAQRRFDQALSALFTAMADHLTHADRPVSSEELEEALQKLDEAIHRAYNPVPARPQAVLALSRTVVQVLVDLARDVGSFRSPFPVRTLKPMENRTPTMQTR